MISIIVPVYNAANYLPRCLDSIFGQDYPDYEVIVVDDGSTDDSPAICRRYAEQHPSMQLIVRSNGGPSAARNTGLQAAQGDWIAFIDSDDEVHPHYLTALMEQARASSAEIVQVHAEHHPDGFAHAPALPAHPTTLQYTGAEALSALLYQQRVDASVHGKLIRSNLLADERFDECFQVYEDLHLMARLFCRVDRVVWIDLPLYSYLKKQGGQLNTHSIHRTDAFDVCDAIEHLVAPRWPHLVAAVHDRKLSVAFNIFRLIAALPTPPDESVCDIERLCRCHIRALRAGSLFNPHVRMKNKCGILLSYLGFPLLKRLFRLHDCNKI